MLRDHARSDEAKRQAKDRAEEISKLKAERDSARTERDSYKKQLDAGGSTGEFVPVGSLYIKK